MTIRLTFQHKRNVMGRHSVLCFSSTDLDAMIRTWAMYEYKLMGYEYVELP